MNNTIQPLPRGRTAAALMTTPFHADRVQSCIGVLILANILYIPYRALSHKKIELLSKEANIKIFMCVWGAFTTVWTFRALYCTLSPQDLTDELYEDYQDKKNEQNKLLKPTNADEMKTYLDKRAALNNDIQDTEYCYGLPSNWDPINLNEKQIHPLSLPRTAKSLLLQPFSVENILFDIAQVIFVNVAIAAYRVIAHKKIEFLSAKTNSHMLLLALGYQIFVSSLEVLELAYNPHGKTQHIYGLYSEIKRSYGDLALCQAGLLTQQLERKKNSKQSANPFQEQQSISKDQTDTKIAQFKLMMEDEKTKLQAMKTRYNLTKNWNPYPGSNDSLG